MSFGFCMVLDIFSSNGDVGLMSLCLVIICWCEFKFYVEFIKYIYNYTVYKTWFFLN